MTLPTTTEHPLSERQQQVLRFIADYCRAQSRAPTYDEIAAHFRFRSQNAAVYHVNELARRGVLTVTRGIARGIRVNAEPQREAA